MDWRPDLRKILGYIRGGVIKESLGGGALKTGGLSGSLGVSRGGEDFPR